MIETSRLGCSSGAAGPCALVLALLLAGCASLAPPRQPPSVLLVITDSLRCDRLRLYNPEDGVATPAIEEVAARGVVFRNAWAVAPWTAPSVVSIFTGLYPPSHGVVSRDDTTAADLPTLPRLLAARGYRLGNFAFFSGVSYFRNLGFPAPSPDPASDRGAALGRFLAAPGPFLAWVHLVEAHLPYGASGYASPSVRARGSTGLELAQRRAEVPVGSVAFAPGDAERLRALYDDDVAALDRTVGTVLDALTGSGRFADTIVVLVADHGEELLDHGWVGHASTAIEAKLAPEILRVPLIVAGPGVPQATVSDQLAQQVDVVPTLLRLLRLRAPRPLDGAPLLPPGSDPGRELVYFDTAAGGNLTPDNRRGERLQGVSDGRALLTSRLGSGVPEEVALTSIAAEAGAPRSTEAAGHRLAAALAGWRRRQATQRLALLRGRETPPPAEDADAYAVAITVTSPAAGEALDGERTGSQIVLAWEGAANGAVVEYDIGSGLDRVRGRFTASGGRLAFGPFPRGFWDDLAGHNPFRFRIVDAATRTRSAWVEFTLVAGR